MRRRGVAAWVAKAAAGAAAAAAERRWQRRRQTTASVRRRWKKMVFALSQFWCQKRRPSVRTAELFPPLSEYPVSIATVLFFCTSSWWIHPTRPALFKMWGAQKSRKISQNTGAQKSRKISQNTSIACHFRHAVTHIISPFTLPTHKY